MEILLRSNFLCKTLLEKVLYFGEGFLLKRLYYFFASNSYFMCIVKNAIFHMCSIITKRITSDHLQRSETTNKRVNQN